MSTNVLTMAPLQWSALRDIDEVKPINDGDTDCLFEVRDVLKKHGKADRIGVALLHSHFDMRDDEIMLEYCDEETRTLTTKAVKQSEAGDSNVGTVFMLRDGNDLVTMSWCRKYCYDGLLGHSKRHNSVPGK